MPATELAVRRDGEALVFTGPLLRAGVPAAWRAAAGALAGVRRLDLRAVERVDSAGLALLAELAARCGDVAVDGAPAGLAELRAAYRLTPGLRYAA